jgi:hypothetical protein
MTQRSPHTLYGYWNELRAGRIAPRRLEVEPSRIAGILAETFMLEHVNADTYPYRLAGTRLCELFGAELRATNFLTGWQHADHALLARGLGLLCDAGAVITLEIEVTVATRHVLEFDAILLPLLHVGNTVTRVIGAMSLLSPTPMLDGGRPLQRRLRRHEVIWPDSRPDGVLERAATRAHLQATHVQSSARGPRPQLRVLDGGRSNWKPGPR